MRTKSHIALLTIMLVGSLLLVASSSIAQQNPPVGQTEKYKITDLGNYQGFDTEPVSIDNKGEVLAEAITSKDKLAIGSELHRLSLIWDNDQWTQLFTPLGTVDTAPTALSRSGWIIVLAVTARSSYICVWKNAQGERTDYPVADNTLANDINDSAVVVGRVLDTSHPFQMYPVLWRDGESKRLAAPTKGIANAKSINNLNDIVGDSVNFGAARDSAGLWPNHAVLWRDGKMIDLGTLGGLNSRANYINDTGEVVGQSDTIPVVSGVPPGAKRHACLWKDGKIMDLGTLGGDESWADKINAKDQIIGTSDIPARNSPQSGAFDLEQATEDSLHSFLWENGKMYDLESLIPKDSGWKALTETGINDSGEIVGTGYLNGVQRPFLMTPIVPPKSNP